MINTEEMQRAPDIFPFPTKLIKWPIDSRRREAAGDTWNYEYASPSVLDNVVGLYVDNGCFVRDPAGENYCYMHIREYPGEVFHDSGTVGALNAIAKIRTVDDPAIYPLTYMFAPEISINKPPRRMPGKLHISFQTYDGDEYHIGEHDFVLCIYVRADVTEAFKGLQAVREQHQAENDAGIDTMIPIVKAQRHALEAGGQQPEFQTTMQYVSYDTAQPQMTGNNANTVLPRLQPHPQPPPEGEPKPKRYQKNIRGHI